MSILQKLNSKVWRNKHAPSNIESFKATTTVEYWKAPWFEPLYAKSYPVRFSMHAIFDYDLLSLKKSDTEKTNTRNLCCHLF